MKHSLLARALRWCGAGLALGAAVARGAGAAGNDADAADDATISLPPLLVEERLAPMRWRYLAAPGMEVLSVRDDGLTRGFARRVWELEQVLRVLVPLQFQAHSSVPEIQILFNEDLTRAKSQEIMQEMLRREKDTRPSGETEAGSRAALAPWQQRRVVFMPNLRLSDVDASAVFVATQDSATTQLEFTFVPDRIRFLLERRVPALPDWFVAGTVGLYERSTLRRDGVIIEPAIWISEAGTRALLADENHPRTLWPMQELLAARHPKPGDESGELAQVWRAQCALFVRWAVVEDGGARKAGLWKLVERLDHEALTEALFRECLGWGFADVRDQLSDYLPIALERGGTVAAPKRGEPPELKVRAATVVEIARLRGEWERMQITYVKRRFPALTSKYIDQARNTLEDAYGRGERDPQLLAVIGLTECDAGNPAGARAYLEAAVREGVVRPRVYVELARLRFAEVLADAGDRAFNSAQVARVLDPLRALRGMDPLLPEGYGLLAETLSRSAAAPPAVDLAWLSEGAAKFPWFSPLLLRTIHLHAARGLVEPAITLAHAGARASVDEETREEFARVLARLMAERAEAPVR